MLTEAQEAARLTGLTSSDAWRLLHPELWVELAAELAAGRPEKEDTPAMQRGRDNEARICDAAAALMDWSIFECDTCYHATVPYILAHPDRIIASAEPGVMEAKCPGSAFVAANYVEAWTTQLHWHLLATGYTWGSLVVGYGNWKSGDLELRLIPVQRNPRLMDLMLGLATEFWAIKETLCTATTSAS